MPALAHDWVKALMAILLKYQSIVGVGELGEVLLRLSQGLRRLRELLTDPARTTFVAVTRPAALPHAETLRLLRRLRAASISVPAVIVNAVGAGTAHDVRANPGCSSGSSRRWRGSSTAAATDQRSSSRQDGCRRPRGPADLRRFAASWRLRAPRGFGSPALTGPPLRPRYHHRDFMATATYIYCLVQSARKPSTARAPRGLPRRDTRACRRS